MRGWRLTASIRYPQAEGNARYASPAVAARRIILLLGGTPASLSRSKEMHMNTPLNTQWQHPLTRQHERIRQQRDTVRRLRRQLWRHSNRRYPPVHRTTADSTLACLEDACGVRATLPRLKGRGLTRILIKKCLAPAD